MLSYNISFLFNLYVSIYLCLGIDSLVWAAKNKYHDVLKILLEHGEYIYSYG